MRNRKLFFLNIAMAALPICTMAQSQQELNSGWKAMQASAVKVSGSQLSLPDYQLSKWMPATVPGTVLTTLLDNKKVPDPFFGMNNNKIADIYSAGKSEYTYWFAKDFSVEKPKGDEQVYLKFRGVNYGFTLFLNGKKLNDSIEKGMFSIHRFNITPYLQSNGKNRIAVVVFPPDEVGNPNGGQGGDGTIARNVSLQYTAGWDWIQPIRDRNTGIWDKVILEKTGGIRIDQPHFVTLVPGTRMADGAQAPAFVQFSSDLENPTNKSISGKIQLLITGQQIEKAISLPAHSHTQISLPEITIAHPKLWWPNTYGPQNLYTATISFVKSDGAISDRKTQEIGIRQLRHVWNEHTRSMEMSINGQKIFIKGGNWVASDEMMRFSDARYDAEVRFHRDMNLNTIRVWGGGLVERPEFYEACDKYGMLVMQDFWGSGDCNGRWVDPMKKDDQWTRRKYPDDHDLFIQSAADQIREIRNYPSLAIWCGGNEIMLPDDIQHAVKDSLMPLLDGTRWFIDYSNSDSMSYNSLGGNGDGPYGIQNTKVFWNFKTWPFNSEIGSVGIGDLTSLQRFLPKENQVIPIDKPKSEAVEDSVWTYHKYITYGNAVDQYGKAKDLQDFANKAQLVNYDQYRALIEGFTAHQWDWYTGIMIWKTQNPWTALRGQMYDYYLDPNACLYGLHEGGKPIHIMMSPADSTLWIVNNGFTTKRSVMTIAKWYDRQGHEHPITQVFSEMVPSNSKLILSLSDILKQYKDRVAFVALELRDQKQQLIDQNIYWMADSKGSYAYLMTMAPVKPKISIDKISGTKINVKIAVPKEENIAFFNRLSVVDKKTGKRLLPTFYDDNYVTILPGEEKIISISYPENNSAALEIEGVNVQKQIIDF